MKTYIKIIIYSVISSLIISGGWIYAAPQYRIEREIQPETNDTYYLGTTSPSEKRWKNIYSSELDISGEITAGYFTATSTTATSTFAGGFAVETNGLVYDFTTNGVGVGIDPLAGTKLLLPQENDVVTPTLAFGDGDTGIYEGSDDVLKFAIAGEEKWQIGSTYLRSADNGGGALLQIGTSASVPFVYIMGDTDTGVGQATTDQLSLIAGGVEGIRITEDAGAIYIGAGIAPVTGVSLLLPQEDDASTPTLAFGPGNDGFYLKDGNSILGIAINGNLAHNISANYLYGNTSLGYMLNVAAGSATSPVYTFSDDTNTGIARSAVDRLSLIAGAKEVIRMNTIAGGVNYFDFYPSAAGSGIELKAGGTDTNIDIVMTPKGAGNFGIGTTSPIALLSMEDANIPQFLIDNKGDGFLSTFATNVSAGLAFDSSQPLIIYGQSYANRGGVSGITERFRIQGSGNVGIGTTSPSERLSVAGGTISDYYVEYSGLYIGNALEKVKNIKHKAGTEKDDWADVDHSTLPDGVRYEKELKNILRYDIGAMGEKIPVYATTTYTFFGRDLGNSVQFNLQAIRELYEINVRQTERIEALELKINKINGLGNACN